MKIHPSCKRLLSLGIVGLYLIAGATAATAEEFRVESKVFSGKDEAPVSESLTLFADGRVYDFLSSPREITVFDFIRGRIVLIDPVRKVRTEMTTEQLNDFIDKLRSHALLKTMPCQNSPPSHSSPNRNRPTAGNNSPVRS